VDFGRKSSLFATNDRATFPQPLPMLGEKPVEIESGPRPGVPDDLCKARRERGRSVRRLRLLDITPLIVRQSSSPHTPAAEPPQAEPVLRATAPDLG
jgi:hypothetical protein